jgi:DNA-directed RNA polymerase specialized sigma subunit
MSKVPDNYYFIEGQVSPWILEWQKIYFKQKDLEEKIKEGDDSLIEELKKVTINSKEFLEKIMEQTMKIIKGVIFRAKFHKKEKYDTCFQIAVEACMKALPRFNPEMGTAFNYLSLTAKRSIIYYLIKKRKKKTLSLEYEYMGDDNLKLKNLIKQEQKTIRNLEIDNIIETILNLIYSNNQHESLANVARELREYLFYSQGKYDKKDFFKWAKADGISANLLRKFTKFIKEHKDEVYSEVGVY